MWIQKGLYYATLPIANAWEMELAVDNNEAFGALLTDLSKAFDCLSHDLLIAKLHCLSLTSLRILTDIYQIGNNE